MYKWKPGIADEEIKAALHEVEALADKIPGIIEISTGENKSKYGEGYSHVIFVRGDNQTALDAYRAHPDHDKVARRIEAMEDAGIGVDFESK